MLVRILGATALALVMGAGLMVVLTGAPDESPEGASTDAAGEPGRRIFQGKGNCAACHGREGAGTGIAPDLADDQWIAFEERPTVQQVKTLVEEGVPRPKAFPSPMPPRGGARLDQQELAAVSAYVLTLSSPGS